MEAVNCSVQEGQPLQRCHGDMLSIWWSWAFWGAPSLFHWTGTCFVFLINQTSLISYLKLWTQYFPYAIQILKVHLIVLVYNLGLKWKRNPSKLNHTSAHKMCLCEDEKAKYIYGQVLAISAAIILCFLVVNRSLILKYQLYLLLFIVSWFFGCVFTGKEGMLCFLPLHLLWLD